MILNLGCGLSKVRKFVDCQRKIESITVFIYILILLNIYRLINIFLEIIVKNM